MESGNQTPKGARYALIGAGAILAVSLGYAALRGGGAPKPAPTPDSAIALTVDSLEEAVKATPDDPKAWAALGEAYFVRSDYPNAVRALDRAATLDPKAPGYWSALGEARIYAGAPEPMPDAALDAFRKAVALDPKDPRARYFLAVKRDLLGDHKGALDEWFALLAETPPGAVWEAGLRSTILQSGKKYGIDVSARLASVRQPAPPAAAAGAMPGPTDDQVRAAAAMSPDQQMAMGRGMVERLEARLAADPKNLDGWVMLMRSRMTLGEPDKARAALDAAVAANPGAKAELEAQARGLGVR